MPKQENEIFILKSFNKRFFQIPSSETRWRFGRTKDDLDENIDLIAYIGLVRQII